MSVPLKPDLRYRAFLAYRDAKHRAEKTMQYDDAQRAADAWISFINASLPEDHRIPLPALLDNLHSGETLQ